MPTTHTFQIIIIGGGLVGASLALGLAHLPLQITVIEANAAQAPTSTTENRTLALARTSCQILHQLGLWDALKDHVTPIQQVHVSEAGRFGILRLKASEQNLPAFGYAIAAEKLTAQIQQCAMQHPNIQWISPAKVTQLKKETHGYTIEIQQNNTFNTLFADLLVAAEGSNSPTRKMLGISAKTHDFQENAITTSIQTSKPHQNIAYERFSPTGPLGLLPGIDNQYALAWVCAPEKTAMLMKLEEAMFVKALQKILGSRLGKIINVGKRVSYPLHSTHAQQQILPHAVLLGNAAHTLHPVAAQGFNLSLRDMRILVENIEQALQVSQNPGDIGVLEKYLSARKFEQNTLRYATESLVHIFALNLPPIPFSRNAAMFALNFLPRVRRKISELGMGL